MQPNQHIAELGPLLDQLGIRHVIIAPGSRNAPLIQLFTSSEPFHCYSVVDERSAGYIALGMASTLKQPVAVVTTSGTAVLNLAPSIAEAFYQQVPLLILTADRPVESMRQFNNQVIDQIAPFYNFTKGFYELAPGPRDEQGIKETLTHIAELVEEGLAYPPGPVHINVPLLEPLYDPLPDPQAEFQIGPPVPVSGPAGSADAIPGEAGQKVLVLAGAGIYDEKTAMRLKQISGNLPWVIVAENISNLHSEQFVSHPEVILAGAGEEELGRLKPDLVIGLGGQMVSKRLKNFIQSDPGIRTIVPEEDPSSYVRKLLHVTEEQKKGYRNEYLHAWKSVEKRVMERAARATGSFPFSNLTVISEVLRLAPSGSVIHLGNSTTIRYSQLLADRRDLSYYSNRGTSGIDGSVSTAVGAALVSDKLHLLMVGDLSFVYDSNALWNQRFPDNLRIIVLNDGGGDIFRILDGPGRMEFFEEFSVTHHPVSIELLVQAFGRRFGRASGSGELKENLDLLMQPDGALSVLEVDTTASENSRIFKAFFEKIR